MSVLGELLQETREMPEASQERRRSTLVETAAPQRLTKCSIQEEQIQILVQQLFLRPGTRAIRRVGFAPVEGSTQTAQMCLDVARVLVNESNHEVGLIDATIDEMPLQALLKIPAPAGITAPWAIAQRLWLAPRESWCSELQHPLNDQNLERFREITKEFDFSIVHCPAVSWVTARIGHICDGLVLVISAGRTRQQVAAQVNEQLRRAHVPVLGLVLTERQFPIPERLYRSL